VHLFTEVTKQCVQYSVWISTISRLQGWI